MRQFTLSLAVLIMTSATSSASEPAGGASGPASRQGRLRPIVEAEQEVYSYRPADNGAGPMWCFGNTCVVRVGEQVLASGIRTLEDHKPLNNVRWELWRLTDKTWRRLSDGNDSHEREPCPLVCFDDGRVFLSTNPSSCPPDKYDGPATPLVLQFRPGATNGWETLTPEWDRQIAFGGHTYRSFAADPDRRELILFYNTGYDRTYWTFLDASSRWAFRGELEFPWGAEYDKPQPVRVCYPTVQLTGRKVHFCGVSDVVEPYQAWRDYKKKLTGREWDYDFRRLFYTWSDDIAGGKFHKWVEIASRDKTAGWIMPCDLWAAADGRVHLLWIERAIDTRLRKDFFPDAKQSIALNYAVVRDGKAVLRTAVQRWDEGRPGPEPGRGRFHVTPDRRLLVVYYGHGRDRDGKAIAENRLVEIDAQGQPGPPVKIELRRPMEAFFTAGVRGGSAPSMVIDLLGECEQTIRYVRIRLQ